MLAKIKEKDKAIELRKRGFSYREILKKVHVAKSSLSLWLKSVKLASSQKQRLTAKKLAGMSRGWESRRKKRIEITKEIKDRAKKQIGRLSRRELWLIGIALYWGEGTKEKYDNPGSGVEFSNSDKFMVKVFIKWLLGVVQITKKEIFFEIYIHENHKHNMSRAIKHWSNCTGFPKSKFNKVYYKKNKIKTNRKNTGNNYFGLLRVNVKSSSSLNRKIQGWIEGIYCEVV